MMCANALPSSSSSPSPSPLHHSGRSFLSRLTSPLRSRTRNLTDFQIRLDEPHRKYSPGDSIKGAVVLTALKPIGITHLTVCLHGFVRVFKNPAAAFEPFVDPGLTASNNPRKSQYFGNGHASLFQDEVTLCGKGRLDVGVYEFNFDLEFPSKGLPTSIDFERGTISYLITATITRPTSIAATSSCDTKVSLVETIDVGPMLPSKPRTISLEPISRKIKRKKTGKSKNGSSESSGDGSRESGSKDGTDDGSKESIKRLGKAGPSDLAASVPDVDPARMTSPLPDDSASQCGSVDNPAAPRSPVPSEIHSMVSAANSNDSTISNSTGMSLRVAAVPSSTLSAQDSQGSRASLSGQTITATIELLKSGCLPGDNLPLKVTIKHTKPIRSMHGIIITFYRQGRIDSAPPLSLFADMDEKEIERLKHEEYYPKSKTGLGGLSLTSAGSSSLFRKDLAQTFAPILVDPVTLTAVVQASVRVPEDVFPTIAKVPGQMITFKYHVEVVVDLGGKLAGQQRHVPRVGAVSIPSSYLNASGARGEVGANMLATWGGSIVGTENIRREKSVVACLFEVVVGTLDSARIRARGNSSIRRQVHGVTDDAAKAPPKPHSPIREEYNQLDPEHNYGDGYNPNPYPYDDHIDHYHDHHHPGDGYHNDGYHHEQYLPPAHVSLPIPPPDRPPEEGLSEKELARRAEERLLPSRPPDIHGLSSSTTIVPILPPSAPPPDAEDDLYGADDITPQATNIPLSNLMSTHLQPALSSNDANLAASTSASNIPTDDKQELERRRLLAEASRPTAPPEADDNGGEESSSSNNAAHAPSAPVLNEDDEYGGQYSHHDLPGPSRYRELLPRYEK